MKNISPIDVDIAADVDWWYEHLERYRTNVRHAVYMAYLNLFKVSVLTALISKAPTTQGMSSERDKAMRIYWGRIKWVSVALLLDDRELLMGEKDQLDPYLLRALSGRDRDFEVNAALGAFIDRACRED